MFFRFRPGNKPGEQTTRFYHGPGHAGMLLRIDTVEPVAQYADRRQRMAKGGFVSGSIDAIGQAADDEQIRKGQGSDKFVRCLSAPFRRCSGTHNREYLRGVQISSSFIE